MAIKIVIEGDDKDELIAAATAVLEMLGSEAPAEEEVVEEEAEAEAGDDLVGEEVDESEAIRDKIKSTVLKLAKAKGGPEKVKAAFKKVKANRLADVEDKHLKTVAKLLGVKV